MITKVQKKRINERAWQLARLAYERYRAEMQQAWMLDEEFNPEDWQPGEVHDQPDR